MSYSYKGKILISTPDVSGDIFSRSVVLILDHNESGAFGLILNRASMEISTRISEIFGTRVEVYEGGPVENNKTFFIVKGKPATEFFLRINEEFYLTEDLETIVAGIITEKISLQDMKVFSGYSGWGAGQLEGEVAAKYWTAVEVYNLDFTMPNDQSLWKNIMQNLGGEYLLWANAPKDVSLN